MATDVTNTPLCTLANFYAPLGPGDIPERVLAKARRTLADFLCETVAGYCEGDVAAIWNAYARDIGGKPEAVILCDGTKVPAMNAAMATGIMARPPGG